MFDDTLGAARNSIDALVTFPKAHVHKYDIRAERKALEAQGITTEMILEAVFSCVAQDLTRTPYGSIDLKLSSFLRDASLRALRMKGLIKDTDKYVAQVTVKGFLSGGWKYWFADPHVPTALLPYRRRD